MRPKKKTQDKSLPECECCGNHDETTHHTVDPYALEINNEEIEVFWCEDCVYERAQDI